MTTPRPDPAGVIPAEAVGESFDTALISRLVGQFFSGRPDAEGPAGIAPGAPGPTPNVPTTIAGAPGHAPGVPTGAPTSPAGVFTPPTVPSEPPSDFTIPGLEAPVERARSATPDRSADRSAVHLPESAPASLPNVPSTGAATSPNDISLTGGFPSTDPSAPPPVHPTVVAGEPEVEEEEAVAPSGAHHPGATDSYEFGEPRCNGTTFGPRDPASKSDREPIATTPASSPYGGRPSSFPGLESVSESEYYFLGGQGQERAPKGAGLPHPAGGPSLTTFDVEGVRRDFPALHQRVNGRPLIWLDNAATTHKPQSVIDATSRFYGRDNSNIHRAAHTLAARSTELFESGREKVRQFLGAADKNEIVFVRGTTEAVNLVAQSYGRQNVSAGDEIIVSQMEHHANIVPWQILAQQTGAKIRVIPIDERGELRVEELPRLLGPRTKLVAVTHVSNALGTINPVQEIIALAHSYGVPVLIDGAQSTPHIPINVTALDADFFVFSGHKIFGPTGIGALYGKAHLLDSMPPWQGGGHMIRDVTFEKTVYQSAPEKFEAGTPDIAGVVGIGAAIDYLLGVGLPAVAAYEHALLEYGTELLASIPGVRPIGTAANKASVFGFVIPGVPNEKIAKHLDQHGIAVRAGHHCAMPAVRSFGVEGTVRPSVAFYNTFEELDIFASALRSLPRA